MLTHLSAKIAQKHNSIFQIYLDVALRSWSLRACIRTNVTLCDMYLWCKLYI